MRTMIRSIDIQQTALCWRALPYVAGLGAALVSAAWWFGSASEPRHVRALAVLTIDTDGDGLPDELEARLGTSPDDADGDDDGFSDLEEIVRGSAPDRAYSVPANEPVALNIDAYETDVAIHALTAVYLADGDLQSRTLTVGMLINNVLTPLPLRAFRGGGPLLALPGHEPGSTIVVLDPVLPTAAMQVTGSLSFFATLAGGGQYLAADALNLTLVDGDIFEHVVTGYHTGVPDPDLSVGMGVGGVYQPLGSGSPGSGNATQGEICAQTTIIVGMVGAVITQEVVAADCVPGWDAYCSRGCADTVGSTIKMIDPATLIGG